MKSALFACVLASLVMLGACSIQVYLVPHTHDDVGWTDTIDGYYESEVQYILNTVVSSLIANPERKFIYVEQAYFWRWWTSSATTEQQRQDFRTIYNNGQLEFVIGGWVMQDEACTTYGADINQMTLGHQFIYETFGAVPSKGWQIDPFGASSVTPTLNKLAGFNAHLIDRVTNKPQLEQNKQLQFNWIGSPSLGEEAAIFTEIMNGNTNAYCDWMFAVNAAGNVERVANQFYSQVKNYANNILSNVLLADVGCDFEYQNATAHFYALDLLMEYFKQNENSTGIYVRYATLSEYYDALLATTSNISYPTVNYTDFLPLDQGDYWTGYYTSRTLLKGLTRMGEAVSHAVEPVFALSKVALSNWNNQTAYEGYANLTLLRQANGDAQHHDGVTGTSIPQVVLMYQDDLINGAAAAYSTFSNLISSWVSQGASDNVLTSSEQAIINIQAGQVLPLVLYNSLGWPRVEVVRLPTNLQSVSVTDAAGNTIVSQVNKNYLSNANATYNLFFEAFTPAVGYATYFITGGSSTAKIHPVEAAGDIILGNDILNVTISGTTGRISNVLNLYSGVNTAVDQNLLGYEARHSGAYVFSPAGPATPITNSPPTNVVQSGPVVDEVFQTFEDYAQQVVRLYKSSQRENPAVSGFVEISFALGPLPDGLEVVTAFTTSVQNGQYISTDDNGFEFLNRTANANVIQGNYYPTIYSSFIQDSTTRVTVASERTHGVSTQSQGEIELMVHRNPNMGDGWGPSLTDNTTVFPSVHLIVEDVKYAAFATRVHPYFLNFPVVPFFGAATSSSSNWKYTPVGQLITGELPPNVHFLSLYALDGAPTKSIFRLTHLFAVNEDPEFSQPATVDVAKLFSNFQISSFVETTLTANTVINPSASTTVQLTPKQIRTFVVEFA